MKLAANTITDEQIRELQRDVGKAPSLSVSDRMLLQDCRNALFNTSIGYCAPHERKHYERTRRDARARFAEILSAKEPIVR